jgi:ATP-binding cassette, subfamily B, bacterial
MILDNGRISEYGSRIKLAEDAESQFSRLLRTGMEEVLA